MLTSFFTYSWDGVVLHCNNGYVVSDLEQLDEEQDEGSEDADEAEQPDPWAEEDEEEFKEGLFDRQGSTCHGRGCIYLSSLVLPYYCIVSHP